MLLTTLRLDETLLIGDDIRLSVREIVHRASTDTMQVKFGIEAPPDVLILRTELLGRKPPPEGT